MQQPEGAAGRARAVCRLAQLPGIPVHRTGLSARKNRDTNGGWNFPILLHIICMQLYGIARELSGPAAVILAHLRHGLATLGSQCTMPAAAPGTEFGCRSGRLPRRSPRRVTIPPFTPQNCTESLGKTFFGVVSACVSSCQRQEFCTSRPRPDRSESPTRECESMTHGRWDFKKKTQCIRFTTTLYDSSISLYLVFRGTMTCIIEPSPLFIVVV